VGVPKYSVHWNSGLNVRLTGNREYRGSEFCSSLDTSLLDQSPHRTIQKIYTNKFSS
jgi:hypothetical protein